MKKLIAILCFALAFLPAQKLFAQKFSIGAGTSSHGYVFHGDNESKAAVAPGLSIDFEATFPVSKVFGVAAGASLTGVAGYHFGGNDALNLGEIYLDVPVRARFDIPVGGRNNLFLFTGPVLSVNLVSIDAHASGTTSNYDTIKDLRRFDVMFGFGVGIDIIEHIRVALGFDYGLLDRLASANEKCHHSQLKLGVQYIF